MKLIKNPNSNVLSLLLGTAASGVLAFTAVLVINSGVSGFEPPSGVALAVPYESVESLTGSSDAIVLARYVGDGEDIELSSPGRPSYEERAEAGKLDSGVVTFHVQRYLVTEVVEGDVSPPVIFQEYGEVSNAEEESSFGTGEMNKSQVEVLVRVPGSSSGPAYEGVREPEVGEEHVLILKQRQGEEYYELVGGEQGRYDIKHANELTSEDLLDHEMFPVQRALEGVRIEDLDTTTTGILVETETHYQVQGWFLGGGDYANNADPADRKPVPPQLEGTVLEEPNTK